MTEKVNITQKQLEEGIYECYKMYRDWHSLTRSEQVFIADFADELCANLFSKIEVNND